MFGNAIIQKISPPPAHVVVSSAVEGALMLRIACGERTQECLSGVGMGGGRLEVQRPSQSVHSEKTRVSARGPGRSASSPDDFDSTELYDVRHRDAMT